MANYHVGCGAFGIYAGTLNKKGNMWLNKNEVTNECLSASAQFLLERNESMQFEYRGKQYRLSVKEVNE